LNYQTPSFIRKHEKTEDEDENEDEDEDENEDENEDEGCRLTPTPPRRITYYLLFGAGEARKKHDRIR